MSKKDITVSKADEMLPKGQMGVYAIQHFFAMYCGAVSIPFIIGAAAGLNQTQLAILIAADLFTCGLATLVQTLGIGKFAGIRLPVLLGCSFTAIGPLVGIVKTSGLDAGFGAIIASGIFLTLIAGFLSKIVKLFPEVVRGSIIIVVALSLFGTGVGYAAGGIGKPGYGSTSNLLLALLVIVVIILVNRFFDGFIRTISIFIGIVVGAVVASIFGMIDFSAVINAKWFGLVKPFYFGIPKFELVPILIMCLTMTVIAIESFTTFYVVGSVCEKEITKKDIEKGFRAEGLACLLGGIFNSFPYTTYFTNLGLVVMTGVGSRFVVAGTGIFLVALGLVPKFAALATIIPFSVYGGAMIMMFSAIIISGIQAMQHADFNKNGNLVIASSTIGIGFAFTMGSSLFANTPLAVNILIGHNGIVVASLIGVILNLLFNYKEIFSIKEPVIKDDLMSAS